MIRMQGNNAHLLVNAAQNRGADRRGSGSGSTDGFGELLNRAATDAAPVTGPAENPQTRSQATDGASDNRSNDGQNQTQAGENTQRAENADYQSQPQEVYEVQEPVSADYAKALVYEEVAQPLVYVVVDEEALMAEVAAALGITVEQLAEVLKKLDMPLEELVEAENRVELILAVVGLESQVELVNYPEALPMVQKLAQAVEVHVQVNNYAGAQAGQVVYGEAEILLEAEVLVEEVMVAQTATRETVAATATTTETAEVLATVVTQTEGAVIQNSAQAAQVENITPTVMDVPMTFEAPTNSANNVASSSVATPAQPVTPQTIVDQVIQNVRFITGDQMAEIRIKLTPAHLGDLSMRIATINGIVTAQFIADSQRVKELIEAGLNMLRDSLEEAGVTVQDVEVNVRGEGGYHDFEAEENISDQRIRDIMAQGIADELEEEVEQPSLEDNIIDYRV